LALYAPRNLANPRSLTSAVGSGAGAAGAVRARNTTVSIAVVAAQPRSIMARANREDGTSLRSSAGGREVPSCPAAGAARASRYVRSSTTIVRKRLSIEQ
jgi:hypothetical protein